MKEGKQRDENGLDSVFCVCVCFFFGLQMTSLQIMIWSEGFIKGTYGKILPSKTRSLPSCLKIRQLMFPQKLSDTMFLSRIEMIFWSWRIGRARGPSKRQVRRQAFYVGNLS